MTEKRRKLDFHVYYQFCRFLVGLELDQKDAKDITDVRITFGQLEKCASEEDISDMSVLSFQNISVDIEEGNI